MRNLVKVLDVLTPQHKILKALWLTAGAGGGGLLLLEQNFFSFVCFSLSLSLFFFLSVFTGSNFFGSPQSLLSQGEPTLYSETVCFDSLWPNRSLEISYSHMVQVPGSKALQITLLKSKTVSIWFQLLFKYQQNFQRRESREREDREAAIVQVLGKLSYFLAKCYGIHGDEYTQSLCSWDSEE